MIRAAKASDVHEVVVLIMAAIGELTTLYTGEASNEKAAPILAQFYTQPGNRFSQQLIKVVELDDQIAGMILCYNGGDAPALYAPIEQFRASALGQGVKHPLEAEPNEYYIDALAVAPQYRGKGLAAQLMLQAEQDALTAGMNQIALLVDVDNTRAKHVYLRQGYEPIGQKMLHHHPYWHMVKRL